MVLHMGRPAHPDKLLRKTLALPEALWVAVTEYRFASRVASETEAVRQLLQRGIACEITIKRRMAAIKAKREKEQRYG